MRLAFMWLALLAAGATASLASGKIAFSRYEGILFRKPFGEPPVEMAAHAAATNATPAAISFAKDFRMSAITESAEFGLRVGFVNVAAGKNYYLRLGEAQDGIQLVDADYANETALLKRGSESFQIRMSGEAGSGDSRSLQAFRVASSQVSPSVSPQALAAIFCQANPGGSGALQAFHPATSVAEPPSPQDIAAIFSQANPGGSESLRFFQAAAAPVRETVPAKTSADASRPDSSKGGDSIQAARAAAAPVVTAAVSAPAQAPSSDPGGQGQSLTAADQQQEPTSTLDTFRSLVLAAQMDVIRAGGEKGPALPVALTKEMDDQLVAEGALPSP